MKDATAPAKSKVVAKAGKPGATEAAGDSKKKFEVKKVSHKATIMERPAECCSGTPLLSGLGTLLSTIALSAETTSWISASNARQIKALLQTKNALLLGEFAIMLSISIAYRDG